MFPSRASFTGFAQCEPPSRDLRKCATIILFYLRRQFYACYRSHILHLHRQDLHLIFYIFWICFKFQRKTSHWSQLAQVVSGIFLRNPEFASRALRTQLVRYKPSLKYTKTGA